MITRIIETSARNPLMVCLVVLMMVVFSWYAIHRVPLDAIPDLSDIQVIVVAEWPGQSPDLMEDQVTYPLVSALVSVPRVKTVRGYSYFGQAFIYVLFQDGTDLYWARSRILEYLQQIKDRLPQGVRVSLGPDATGVGWVFQYALVDTTGKHDLAELRSFQDFYLKYWLEGVPGVAEVASVGGFVRQYQVLLDPVKLYAYGLSVSEVIKAIRKSNREVGGRVLEFAGKEFFVRGRGYLKGLRDLERIVIKVDPETGTPVLLKDIAEVRLGAELRRGAAELNGQGEVVGGIVVMRYGENALNVIRRVKERLREIEPALPEGVKIVITYDRSGLIKRAIGTLKKTLVEEMVVVSLVIFLFLLHPPSALVAVIVLPVAVAFSFIPMEKLRITANIMSLGGIAIAIGAMVDAVIVLVENAHKHLERETGPRREVILRAAKEVGPPIFFSLLVITISFLPVFALEAQEGKLFKPLAYTKTFSMFFASLLSITLAPALMSWFVRRALPEGKNPFSRLLIALYRPVLRRALKWKWAVIGLSVAALAVTIPAWQRLGSEFMPPLNEGDILYMPTTLPGISITEAVRVLQIQDRLLKSFPEVETVFGKVGRAETATDPAPLSMVETTVRLKPRDQWRPGMTWEKLIEEMDRTLQIPGWTNAWTMPIKTRIDMLTTGVRTPIGIKIYGKDLTTIQKIGEELERVLKEIPGTRSVYAERTSGGYYVDIVPDRTACARYGLTVGDVLEVIRTAVGGMVIDYTVEGRERYPVQVRYAREFRDDLEDLKGILVKTPSGAQVPLGELAEIRMLDGPPMIKDENGFRVGYVYVDVAGRDIGGYVAEAKRLVREKIKLPPGYFLEWSGQYQFMERVKRKLRLLIPITLFLIFFLLYLHFRNLIEVVLIMLSIPFALVGSVWILYFLKYNLSVAVGVGMIALAGVAAETGVVMLVYLDSTYRKRLEAGGVRDRRVLREAVVEGAVMRLRPKVMTVLTTIVGLLPLLWSQGTGADVMRRIAAPMIGGLITSTLVTLLLIPVLYEWWRSRKIA
ncbi:efflux RND transporter permease subunit [Thermosulfurimonas dismutans]|uniref:Cobalt-zinc-cadmium resistance protein CzcA/CusA n=1 Tax=Thermosulfurimonas dismutans TaxID=999894 RepID=A0A179D380_9BACT|nr:CusA/CzcA family heavy metal efflux RND transporter [Thermosulfurimonas dismutans]OAQ20517.1 Cobalt-zinc-cadmium resistance protein CzcA/CusA [Thermosulfurimonas dismutans]